VFATASTDTHIRLWDLRAWGKGARPLATAAHAQTCQAAMFAPDGVWRGAGGGPEVAGGGPEVLWLTLR